jgi:hypothetical protein
MKNIKEIEITTFEGTEIHVIIDKGNNEFESMPKSTWDELKAQKENSPIL